MNLDASGFVSRQVEQRSAELGRQVLGTADSLHKIAEQLRQDELASAAADLADGGAQVVERVGRYLSEADFNRMVSDAERFSRKRPWAVAASGLALGIVASRLVRAAAARRER